MGNEYGQCSKHVKFTHKNFRIKVCQAINIFFATSYLNKHFTLKTCFENILEIAEKQNNALSNKSVNFKRLRLWVMVKKIAWQTTQGCGIVYPTSR